MRIQSLELLNYRSYQNVLLDFSPGINVIYGNNGQGKTNILESIYVLAITKSHRFGNDLNLVQFGKDFTRVSGMIIDGEMRKKMQFFLSGDTKKVYINDKLVKLSNYISNLVVVLFFPDDLEIIKGVPNVRRDCLNIQLCQFYDKYLVYLKEYNKLLKMKNEYLKKLQIDGGGDYKYLDIINEKIIENADRIYRLRYEYLEYINKYIATIYKGITGLSGLSVSLVNNIDVSKYNHDEIFNNLGKKFKYNLKREISNGMCLYGPHRDDISFMLNGLDLKRFGSQGQQRIAVIAYKLAEVMILKSISISPILLLDDIFSEMDAKSIKKLLKYVNGDVQTIITTTNIKDFPNEILSKAKKISIKKGNVNCKGGNNER